MIEVNNLTKSYGSFQALKGISFQLNKGEVVGFLGPNGAGKTSTMRVLTGFLPPTSGTCIVDGRDVVENNLEVRKKIGYLPESTALYSDMEVTEYLRFVGQLRQLGNSLGSRLKIVVDICGLQKAQGKKISTLSKGYRQRVGLAQALIHDPDILILDEPTVGLDPNQIVEIRNLIRSIGETKTILLSSHILSEVSETCSRVIIIADGKIVGQGTPQELINKTEGESVYHIITHAAQEQIREVLKKLPHYKECSIISMESSAVNVQIYFDSTEDMSEEIFKTAVAHNWVLRELRREAMTLEEVFKKLTK